jgi:hypothetical protein
MGTIKKNAQAIAPSAPTMSVIECGAWSGIQVRVPVKCLRKQISYIYSSRNYYRSFYSNFVRS